MKLPPAALTAPSLCPRCDSPAIMTDYCIQCTLPLRRCGSCQGVAGPFDRYCGFCGYELLEGERRPPIWRLWLLAALVPLAAGLAIGVSPLSAPLAKRVQTIVGVSTPAPGTTTTLRSDALGFTYTYPKDWTAADDSRADPARQIPFVVVTSVGADQSKVLDAKGDLLQVKPQGAIVEMGRPPVGNAPVDVSDPAAVLAFQLGPLLATPPAGASVAAAVPVRAITVNGRPGAEAVLRVTRDGQVYEFERAWISTPSGLFRVDALVPDAQWAAGDDQRVEALIRSIRG